MELTYLLEFLVAYISPGSQVARGWRASPHSRRPSAVNDLLGFRVVVVCLLPLVWALIRTRSRN